MHFVLEWKSKHKIEESTLKNPFKRFLKSELGLDYV